MSGDKRKKLTVSDVVQIKRHLMNKDLKQKEIALKFGVAPSAISKIKSGQQWTHVQIDEFGVLIPDESEVEILPENFPVPSIKEVQPEPVAKVDDGTTEYRMQFIEEYFKKRVGQSRFDKDANITHYEPVSKKSKRFIGAMYNSYKYLFNNEWDEFISAVMFSVTKTTMMFESADKNFDWSLASKIGSKENSILHDNINKAVRTDIQDYANSINSSYKVQVDGVEGWMKPVVESLNKITNSEDGDFALIEEMGDTANHFHLKDGYVGSHFLDWFTNNRTNILTHGQDRFLGIMKFFQRDSDDDDYTIPYRHIPDAYKPFTEESRDHNRRRIIERVEEAYAEVEPVSLRKMKHMKELELWESFMIFVDLEDEHIDKQNRIISKWIKDNQDNEFVSKLMWELDAEDILAIRNAPSSGIRSKTLYRVVSMVESRIDHLKGIKEKVVPFVRHANEYGGLSKEDYRKLQNERIRQQKENERTSKSETYTNFRVLPGGKIAAID